MSSPYQEFVRKAKERYEENKKKKAARTGQFQFTEHARYKMKQYGLSEQKVKGIIHRPKRTEVGVAPKTVAMMQPVSTKMIAGKEVWKQEIWVMYQKQSTKNSQQEAMNMKSRPSSLLTARGCLKIISAWRYPGVSPKRSPIPEEIWRELEDGSILEGE